MVILAAPPPPAPTGPRINPITTLTWYFNEGQCLFARSTFAAQAERAQISHRDSTGKTVKNVPPCEKWDYMHVRNDSYHSQERDPGYSNEETDVLRFGQLSRRLLWIDRKSPIAYYTLHACYGPWGERWNGVPGFGRAFAVWPLTKTGQALVKRLRKVTGQEEMRDDDLLAFAKQTEHGDVHRQKFVNMSDEAQVLITKALGLWGQSGKVLGT